MLENLEKFTEELWVGTDKWPEHIRIITTKLREDVNRTLKNDIEWPKNKTTDVEKAILRKWLDEEWILLLHEI